MSPIISNKILFKATLKVHREHGKIDVLLTLETIENGLARISAKKTANINPQELNETFTESLKERIGGSKSHVEVTCHHAYNLSY